MPDEAKLKRRTEIDEQIQKLRDEKRELTRQINESEWEEERQAREARAASGEQPETLTVAPEGAASSFQAGTPGQ
jgi:hypothetical protein